MRPRNRKLSEKRFSNHLRMPSGRSFYHRRPARYAAEQKEFQRLIAELKRLSSKNGYSQEQIASEIGVTKMTVNHWFTGYSLSAKRESIERLKTFLATHQVLALSYYAHEAVAAIPRTNAGFIGEGAFRLPGLDLRNQARRLQGNRSH